MAVVGNPVEQRIQQTGRRHHGWSLQLGQGGGSTDAANSSGCARGRARRRWRKLAAARAKVWAELLWLDAGAKRWVRVHVQRLRVELLTLDEDGAEVMEEGRSRLQRARRRENGRWTAGDSTEGIGHCAWGSSRIAGSSMVVAGEEIDGRWGSGVVEARVNRAPARLWMGLRGHPSGQRPGLVACGCWASSLFLQTEKE
ncbi:hypothetical protein TRIUR3_33346 [Triticum urartu]|uniref:Uncharacterized protein n=1 Tax=Triticum urartu TaxID=4572 RepID=M8AUA7_TRIUA|nr:hypothetical protein TRIUR3_33346 [Triticum urartu]